MAERAVLRANPMWIDLENAREPELAPFLEQLVPVFTAADKLNARHWQGEDLTVSVTRVCPSDTRLCIRLFASASSDKRLERRMRFIAWPLGHAVMVVTSHKENLLSILREACVTKGTRIGLVLARDNPPVPESLAKARSATQRLHRWSAGDLPDRLVQGLSELSSRRALDWLPLSEREILVIPRLAAAAEPQAFADEVRRRVDATGLRAQVLAQW